MTREEERALLAIAERALEGLVRHFARKLGGAFEAGEIRSWAGPGVGEALAKWDGRGRFEAFVAQRCRWALLHGLNRQIKQDRRAGVRRDAEALLAVERSADPHLDGLAAGEAASDGVTTDDLLERAAASFSVRMSGGDALDAAFGVQAAVERDAERIHVKRAVDALPELLRTTVVQYHYLGYTLNEIAEALDKPVTTVFELLRRAERMLAAQLGRDAEENRDGATVVPISRTAAPAPGRGRGRPKKTSGPPEKKPRPAP